MKYKGWLPDFENNEFFFGELVVENQRISSINRIDDPEYSEGLGGNYILPGLVDAHVHIESSMLSPSNFAASVIKYGTVATVSDPHEIANVLGKEGIRFMVEDAAKVPLKIYFTAPSCVPATDLEQSGATLGSKEMAELTEEFEFAALGEMMNFPGVINGDEEIKRKLDLFQKLGKKVDGHAPNLRGEDLRVYIEAGISTDHEAVDIEEAREKIKMGMKILIREGSAARNFENLWPLIGEYPEQVMLCCDDIHPDELMDHHIDHLIVRGREKGLDIFDLIRAASVNPVAHYGLDVGLLREGDKADFIIVDDLENFRIKESYINGACVYKDGARLFNIEKSTTPNKFYRKHVEKEAFEMTGKRGSYRVIGAIDGDLFTSSENHILDDLDGFIVPDTDGDILRIAVVNRYDNSPPALGWIKNTGLKRGALASSIAHDSHNIIVVGTSTQKMAEAVNLIVDNQGGISFADEDSADILPLPIAGLMSSESAEWVGERYNELNIRAIDMGSTLKAPFMTLSFMALLVIPELKIGDRGLFDVKEFKFVENKSS